jgi:hypothetical protein
MRCCIVAVALNAMPMFVFLNRLVIFLICGLWYVNVVQVHSLPLDTNKKKKEWAIIQAIANNNNFPQHAIARLNHQIKNKNDHTQKKEKNT